MLVKFLPSSRAAPARGLVSILICLAIGVATAFGQYNAPTGYYSDAEGVFGDELRGSLNSIIAPHGTRSYADVTLAVRVLDEDPDNANNLILMYSGFSVGKFSNWSAWNREHVWPQSYGADSGPANSDFHHLFPANPGVNSARSNYGFDWAPNGSAVANAPGSRVDAARSVFEPRDEDKGRIARAMMYMDVRYEGNDAGTPDMVLGNFRENSSSSVKRFSNLDALLMWNRMYPPDQRDRRRNHLIYDGFQSGNSFIIQGNRNPFVDYPEFAEALFTIDRYRTWGGYKATHFAISDWRNPDVTDPLAFADNSPVPLLLEFSQDLPPGTAHQGNLPYLTRTASGRISYFYFTEIRNAELTGLEYEIEYSETPLTEGSWATYSFSSAQTLVQGTSDFSRNLRVSDLGLPAGERPRHFRLRVNLNFPVNDPTTAVYDPVAAFNESGSIFAYFPVDGVGWRQTDWMGSVNDAAYPVIEQSHHGQLWVFAEDEEAVWFFDAALGWLYTGRLAQPHFYAADLDAWLTFVDATQSPGRWFFDWSSQTFQSEQSLRTQRNN